MLKFGIVQLSRFCVEYWSMRRKFHPIDPRLRTCDMQYAQWAGHDTITHWTWRVDGTISWRRRCNHIWHGLCHKFAKHTSIAVTGLLGCQRWKKSCFHYFGLTAIGRYNQSVQTQRHEIAGVGAEKCDCLWPTENGCAVEKDINRGRGRFQYGRVYCQSARSDCIEEKIQGIRLSWWSA